MKPILALVGVAIVGLVVAGVLKSAQDRGKQPPYQIIAQQGMYRSIVVDSAIAFKDEALLDIADVLVPDVPGRAVTLQVWTEESMIPARLEAMTDRQLKARVAVVTVDLRTGDRRVDRARALPMPGK